MSMAMIYFSKDILPLNDEIENILNSASQGPTRIKDIFSKQFLLWFLKSLF